MFEGAIGTHLRTSQRSLLLLGPRQVGKSTLLQSLQPDDETLPRVARKILVFLGDRPQRIDGVEVLPLRTFLDELPA